MRLKKAKHGGEQLDIAEPPAQLAWGEAGQRQQSFRPLRLVQGPSERPQRDDGRVDAAICFLLFHDLRLRPGLSGAKKRVGQKILVVEDNELNLRLFCDLLRAHGYEAEPVRDGRDAVERARAFEPHLIVMDIQMPHISGLELIEQMKSDEALKVIPIMAVTAYAAKGDEERIRDAGAEGYVSKPISVVRFVEEVAGLLEASSPTPDGDSDAIRVEYDADGRSLDVWETGGRHCRYLDVPPEAYQALLEAASIGGFVDAEIKPVYAAEQSSSPS